MWPKIIGQNVHNSPKSQLDIANVSKNPVTKSPHFSEQAAGHRKCTKIMQQKVHIPLKSWLDIANV
jgi:hypothetical protein